MRITLYKGIKLKKVHLIWWKAFLVHSFNSLIDIEDGSPCVLNQVDDLNQRTLFFSMIFSIFIIIFNYLFNIHMERKNNQPFRRTGTFCMRFCGVRFKLGILKNDIFLYEYNSLYTYGDYFLFNFSLMTCLTTNLLLSPYRIFGFPRIKLMVVMKKKKVCL